MPLRTTGSEKEPLLRPEATGENSATQVALTYDDNRLASLLFGQYGQNLAMIERRLGVVAEQRGNHVALEGSRDACEQARRVLDGLYARLKRGDEVVSGDVEGAIRLAIAQGSLFDYDGTTARPSFEEINLRKRPVRAPPLRRTPISGRCGAIRWCLAAVRPALARPGSRLRTRCSSTSARRSIASC